MKITIYYKGPEHTQYHRVLKNRVDESTKLKELAKAFSRRNPGLKWKYLLLNGQFMRRTEGNLVLKDGDSIWFTHEYLLFGQLPDLLLSSILLDQLKKLPIPTKATGSIVFANRIPWKVRRHLTVSTRPHRQSFYNGLVAEDCRVHSKDAIFVPDVDVMGKLRSAYILTRESLH